MQSSTQTATSGPDLRSRLWGVASQPFTLVVLLILATIVARRDALATPVGSVRPTLTAMITRNLSRDLGEIGVRAIFYPRVDYAGEQPGYLLQEFPVMNLAGVFLERVLGLQAEVAYRLPSLVCFALMLPLLYSFVRARFGAIEAVATVLFISYFPLVVIQSIEVMPEQGVVTAFLAAIWLFDRHLDGSRMRLLVASAACFGLMLLTKPTSGLLLLVPIGLYRLRRGTLRGFFPRYAIALGACALPLGVWLVHVWRVNQGSVMDDGRSATTLAIVNYLNQHGRFELLATPVTYGRFVDMLASVYGIVPLILFAAGSAYGLSRRGTNRALLGFWLAAFLLYFLVLPFNLTTHPYYSHPFSPLVALGAALALGWLVRSTTSFLPEAGRNPARALLAVLALVFVLNAHWGYEPAYDKKKREFGVALQSVLAPRALGIISSDDKGVWDGEFFWASDTRGWRVSTISGPSWRPISEEFIEERRRRGAEFLAHYGPREDLAAKVPGLYQRLNAGNAVLLSAPEWVVYSLKE